ncbi:MAG: DUF1802 family protein [Thermoproteota archaeon]|nr:DUF1802 family protein [Thermoproteota archaeon]
MSTIQTKKTTTTKMPFLKSTPRLDSNLSREMHDGSLAENSNPVSYYDRSTKITAALKEWAIVCKALEEGRQVLLLRKGGIMEYREGFQVKHNSFLLYPTYEHQSIESIQPDFAHELTAMLQEERDKNKVRITSYARAIAVKQIEDVSLLSQLQKYHIWNESYVQVRVKYNPKKPMQVVLLRVYRLQDPIEVEMNSEWFGCRSWLDIQMFPSLTCLADNHDPFSDRPVIGDSLFDRIALEINEILR